MANELNWSDLNKSVFKAPFCTNSDDWEPALFQVVSKPSSDDVAIHFYENSELLENYHPYFSFEFKGDIDTAKKMVKNTVEHFTDHSRVSKSSLKNHLETQINQLPQQEVSQQPSGIGRQIETAQKTGYVQGVCESVLAFNNDDNRKIMAESTMAFLSKKLLSEMNVTKDMAQKFASPETYKALEQCVFAPEQTQPLEIKGPSR